MSARYPLDALVSASGLSEAALARKVGLSGSSLKAARERGLVEAAADKYACRAGLAPWVVWTDWLADLEVECEEQTCSVRFVPLRRSHRFCSPRCYQRNYQRQRARELYANDEEYREAQKAKARAYRASNKRQIAIKNRLNHERNHDRRLEYQRRYREANREQINARQREYDRRRRAEKSQVTHGQVAA